VLLGRGLNLYSVIPEAAATWSGFTDRQASGGPGVQVRGSEG
jgi:hypothetical protein